LEVTTLYQLDIHLGEYFNTALVPMSIVLVT